MTELTKEIVLYYKKESPSNIDYKHPPVHQGSLHTQAVKLLIVYGSDSQPFHQCGALYILSVYSPFSDRVGLPLHNIHIPSPFTSIIDIFLVDLKFGHIRFYTL